MCSPALLPHVPVCSGTTTGVAHPHMLYAYAVCSIVLNVFAHTPFSNAHVHSVLAMDIAYAVCSIVLSVFAHTTFINAHVHSVLAMDIHSGQCVGYFDIPVDHIFGEVSGLEAPPCVRVGRFEG